MNYTLSTSFLVIALFLFNACHDQPHQDDRTLARIDSLQISKLHVVISAESNVLGEPREIVSVDEEKIAVYDHALKQILVFDTSGNKILGFGSTGEGPGEWDSMSGATDLNYSNHTFFTSNRSRFLFDLYDREGAHIRSIPFDQYLNYSHKVLIDENQLLTTTNGREGALAVVLDLETDGNILDKIGTPESGFSERPNLEEERRRLARGEIPESTLNEALVAKIEDGYIVFLNTLGELRRYSHEGDIIFKKQIPSDIKDPIFKYVSAQNRDEVPPHAVQPLEYAKDVQVKNDLIYIFMPKMSLEDEGLEARILIYNLEGTLLNQYVLADTSNESYLYEIVVDKNHTIYFIDVMKAQLLSFEPDIHEPG